MNPNGRLTPPLPAGLLPRAAAALCSAALALVLVTPALAQEKLDEAATKRLQAQADEMSRIFLAGDHERMADYIPQNVVAMLGGRAKLIETLTRAMKEVKENGFEPLSYVYSGPSQVVRVGPRTYALMSATLKMRTPMGVYVAESYTVAISADGGANWKFVAASNVTPEQLGMLLPEIVGRLDIPKPKPYALEPLPEPSATPTPAPAPAPAPTPTPKP